ncbi:MAG: ORF6N domain-containing protein [Candidatus Taylorbacteria bacterium]|nr:ORF6N domain-containing protein [Candidatus Taylorbacteria bacterium]
MSEEVIQSKIMVIRGKKVILDKDIALLYEVKPIALRQQVNRNTDRFPEDFMFILGEAELVAMVSQNVIPSRKYFGGSLPYVFTEQGIAMLSSVLTSKRAVYVNIQIMRTFAKLREITKSDLINRKIYCQLLQITNIPRREEILCPFKSDFKSLSP